MMIRSQNGGSGGIIEDPDSLIIHHPARTFLHYLPLPLLLLLVTMLALPAIAQAQASETGLAYAEEGTAQCLECHDETEEHPVLSIFHTAHGMVGDGRSPLGDSKGCESCHGPSAGHADKPRTEPAISFGPKWISPASERNAACMNCHAGTQRMHWEDSSHQQEDLGCNDCHQSHVTTDPILKKNQQTGVCFGCHQTQLAESSLPSRHPIKEGKTVCSDCHNPHGSSTIADLNGPSLNETCIGCHKEKRGPFIFEHPPAAEDCSECHKSHGSVQAALLTNRPPFLCQQCHLANFHPSQLNDGTGLATSGLPNRNMLGKSCLNCHAQVHGTNHPSGGRLTR